MSMALDQSCLALPFVTINAYELSETMGVDGWGWSISINVVQIGTAFGPLVNKAPSLDYMSEDIMLHMM